MDTTLLTDYATKLLALALGYVIVQAIRAALHEAKALAPMANAWLEAHVDAKVLATLANLVHAGVVAAEQSYIAAEKAGKLDAWRALWVSKKAFALASFRPMPITTIFRSTSSSWMP